MKSLFKFIFIGLLLLASCKPDPEPEEITPPQLVSVDPANGAMDVSENRTRIVMTFNENVTLKTGYNITLNGSPVSDVQPGTNKELTITVSSLSVSTSYTLIIPANTVKGPTGVYLPTEIKITFKTYTPPVRTYSTEAQKVIDFLKSIYGTKTISGTMANVNWNTDEADWVKVQTGKYPALNCFDYVHHVFSPANWIDYSNTTVAENWWNNNGLVAIMWHWNVPKNINSGSSTEYAFYASNTNFDLSKISDTNSAEYKLIIKDIDIIAGYLKLLKNKNIPVIWRPLHEAAGNTNSYTGGTAWFWWGAKGAAPFKALWKLMFERLTTTHQLNNLIWVWTSQGNDPDWYPGDEYVDIAGRDLYPETNVHDSQIVEFNKVKTIINDHKMIALSECSGIPDPDKMMQNGDTWLWFMPWYGDYTRTDKYNGSTYWKSLFNNPAVITRDKMPSLK